MKEIIKLAISTAWVSSLTMTATKDCCHLPLRCHRYLRRGYPGWVVRASGCGAAIQLSSLHVPLRVVCHNQACWTLMCLWPKNKVKYHFQLLFMDVTCFQQGCWTGLIREVFPPSKEEILLGSHRGKLGDLSFRGFLSEKSLFRTRNVKKTKPLQEDENLNFF